MRGGRRKPVNPENFLRVMDRIDNGDVLDIGSGDSHPHADTTLDADPEMNPDVIHDLNYGLPFSSDEFEYVTAVHVIEHIEDDIELWNNMLRVASDKTIAVVPIGERDDEDHKHVYMKEDVLERFDPDWYGTMRVGPIFDMIFEKVVE